MYVIKQFANNDSHFNMAVDEYLITKKSFDEPVILFNINDRSVIIGRNQNLVEEVDFELCKQLGIQISRRITGGGAVYHDLGNVSFTIIERAGPNKDYKYFSEQIIKALASLGINARFHGRNDLLIGEQKISGAAQFVSGDRILYHATLLFDVDLATLGKVLTPHRLKVESHATKSNPSRVTLIRKHLKDDMTPQEFAERLAAYFLALPGAKELTLSPSDVAAINGLVADKFSKWEWIHGQAADYSFKNKQKFVGGLIELGLNVAKGRIASVKFTGDFLSQADVGEVEKLLVGVKVDKDDLLAFFNQVDMKKYFGSLPVAEVVSLFPIS